MRPVLAVLAVLAVLFLLPLPDLKMGKSGLEAKTIRGYYPEG